MNRLKELLDCDRGMRIVNILFLFCIVTKNIVLWLAAFLMWGAVWAYAFKRSKNRAAKILYAIFTVIAAAGFFASLYLIII